MKSLNEGEDDDATRVLVDKFVSNTNIYLPEFGVQRNFNEDEINLQKFQQKLVASTLSTQLSLQTSVEQLIRIEQNSKSSYGVNSIQLLQPDYHLYFTTFKEDIDFVYMLQEVSTKGLEHIETMYFYRSVSRAIPIASFSPTGDMSAEEKTELAAKKAEYTAKTVEVLRPEIAKLKTLMYYVVEAINLIHNCIVYIATKDQTKEPVQDCVYLELVHLLDILIKIDYLKDAKRCFIMDLLRFREAIGSHSSIDATEEIIQLQNFLAPHETRKKQNYILKTLRDELQRIVNFDEILFDCLDCALHAVEAKHYVSTDEFFRYLRVIPHLLILVDGDSDSQSASATANNSAIGGNSRNFNVFRQISRLRAQRVQRLLTQFIAVPVFGDLSLLLEHVLRLSAHFDEKTMAAQWLAGLDRDQTMPRKFLHAQVSMNQAFSLFVAKLALARNRYHEFPFQKIVDEVAIEVSNDICNIATEGLHLLAQWAIDLQEFIAFKLAFPAAADSDAFDTANYQENRTISYAKIFKFNLSREERNALVERVSLVKSLADLLLENNALFSPFLRFHIHHSLQQFVQGDFLPLLHRVDKRSRPILPILLQLRALAADWATDADPSNDYKEYTRKQGAVQTTNHPARVVGPSASQLYLLRVQVNALCDRTSEVRRKTSLLFGRADLEKSDVACFEDFYQKSFLFPYLLDLSAAVRELSDCAYFWMREISLEESEIVQVPIDLSLPWLLVEHVLSTASTTNISINSTNSSSSGGGNQSSAGRLSLREAAHTQLFIEKVFYLLDLYNDIASHALYVANMQFLYDEIEAELNLAIDQFNFLLADIVYAQYKNLAASTLLEPRFKQQLEESKGNDYLHASCAHLQRILTQKTVLLLGRSINLSLILSQNIHNKLIADIDVSIRKFESGDVRGVIELKTMLNILRLTHEHLSAYLSLEPFALLLQEVDESFAPVAYRGRISLHYLASLVRDILPNFSYNGYTQRFVSSAIAIRPMEYNKAPKPAAVQQVYGALCHKAYEQCAKIHRHFFGRIHWQAFLSLGGALSNLSMVVDQLFKTLCDKLLDVSEYLEALEEGLEVGFLTVSAREHPSTAQMYAQYLEQLQSFMQYDDLKPEVFQNFREVGNAVALLRDLSAELERKDAFEYALFSPVLGVLPHQQSTLKAPSQPDNDHAQTAALSSLSATSAEQTLIVQVVGRLHAQVKHDERCRALLRHGARSEEIVQKSFDNLKRLVENWSHCFGHRDEKHLLRHFLQLLEEFLYQQHLTYDWSFFPPSSAKDEDKPILDLLSAKGFSKLWSALLFLYCVADDDQQETLASREEETISQAGEAVQLSNAAEFGHGFVIAGCLLLHLLGQRAIYEAIDYSRNLLARYSQEQARLDQRARNRVNSSSDSAGSEEVGRDVQMFVEEAEQAIALQREWFTFFESVHIGRAAYMKHSINRVVFHPPREELEEDDF